MSLFDSVIKIDPEEVSAIVKENWAITLGKIIKASQNHTFQGARSEEGAEQKFSIRVTPDPDGSKLPRIQRELQFVTYLSDNKLNHICRPIPIKDSNQTVYSGNKLIISVFEWAKGELLNYVEFQWMKSKDIVLAWGRFFAECHKLSQQFEQTHSDTAKKVQSWRQIHHGVLQDIKLNPEDEKDVESPQHYGVIHGDLNVSNFFYERNTQTLYVFDTDQTQRGFYLWDLSQAVFGVYMLEKAGMPISGNPVPEANTEEFTRLIVEGYESVMGKGSVDLKRLERMVLHKRQFYRLFCTRAIKEGNIPPDMEPFIEYIAKRLGGGQA